MELVKLIFNGEEVVLPGAPTQINWEDINGRPDLTSVSSMKVYPVVLQAALWIDGQQTVSIPDILEDEKEQLIIPVPAAQGREQYVSSGIAAISQSSGSLTFQSNALPASDISVNVYILGAAEVGEVIVGAFEWWSPMMTADNAPMPYAASATSVYNFGGQYFPAWQAFKGLPTVDGYANPGAWISADSANEASITIDIGRQIVVNGFKINPTYTIGHHIESPNNIVISGSNDGESWDTLYTNDSIEWAEPFGKYTELPLEKPARFRYFKFFGKGTDTFINRVSYGDIQFLKLEGT